jgi:hypothetical protein
MHPRLKPCIDFRKDLNSTSNEAPRHPIYARCGFELAANTVSETCKQDRTVENPSPVGHHDSRLCHSILWPFYSGVQSVSCKALAWLAETSRRKIKYIFFQIKSNVRAKAPQHQAPERAFPPGAQARSQSRSKVQQSKQRPRSTSSLNLTCRIVD